MESLEGDYLLSLQFNSFSSFSTPHHWLASYNPPFNQSIKPTIFATQVPEHPQWMPLFRGRYMPTRQLASTDQTRGAETDDVIPSTSESSQGPPPPPYTKEEKDWLKRGWGGEFRFLRLYGLSIYEDEQREAGRMIVRALMEIERRRSR
jgi:hypothetical protein